MTITIYGIKNCDTMKKARAWIDSHGIAYGFSKGMSPEEVVNFGAAHGALLQTTRGDTSQVTLDEVMHVMKGGSARIQR